MAEPARKTYHHGNLHAAAVDAAYDIVAAGDFRRLTIREVADRVGVAHRSLYNHFADREDLLNYVGAETYKRLAQRLRKVKTPERYVAVYVNFALENPSLYDLMTSRPHATMFKHPPLQAAAHLTITEALRVFAKPGQDSPARRRAVMKVYTLLYGGITLHRQGILDVPGDEGLVRELTAMIAAD